MDNKERLVKILEELYESEPVAKLAIEQRRSDALLQARKLLRLANAAIDWLASETNPEAEYSRRELGRASADWRVAELALIANNFEAAQRAVCA